MEPVIQGAVQWLSLAFIAIAFGQSAFDKIVDWKGNLGWLKGHFKNSPLKSFVPMLLAVLTGFELLSGGLCAVAVVQLLLGVRSALPHLAAIVATATFLQLFFGQRMAKDYPGAASLTGYIIISLLAVYFTAPAAV